MAAADSDRVTLREVRLNLRDAVKEIQDDVSQIKLGVARLEQSLVDHLKQHETRVLSWRWAVTVIISVLSLACVIIAKT